MRNRTCTLSVSFFLKSYVVAVFSTRHFPETKWAWPNGPYIVAITTFLIRLSTLVSVGKFCPSASRYMSKLRSAVLPLREKIDRPWGTSLLTFNVACIFKRATVFFLEMPPAAFDGIVGGKYRGTNDWKWGLPVGYLGWDNPSPPIVQNTTRTSKLLGSSINSGAHAIKCLTKHHGEATYFHLPEKNQKWRFLVWLIFSYCGLVCLAVYSVNK
ncbi:hypothetical protein L1887_13729 [Cichorium endivia]|nr:hypothetical protein L1887_13729 [Cichorium endivia]